MRECLLLLTAPIMSQCDPLSIQQNGEVKVIKTILHWQHRRGGEGHCLARVYVHSDSGQIGVLLSEIRSNDRVFGIAADFTGVVNALLDCLKEEMNTPLEQITWIAHYGRFSSYDAIGEDRLLEGTFAWDRQKAVTDQTQQWIALKEALNKLGISELEPIYPVLREIGWTKHNE